MITPHIDSRHLYDASLGVTPLNEDERMHIRTCESCRELLRVFTRLKRIPPLDSKKQSGGSNAA